MSHTCHAEGCSVPVPPKLFACFRHWKMVPKWLQRALWLVYRPGQEAGQARVTSIYLAVQTRCRLAIAEGQAGTGAEAIVTALRVELAERIRAKCPTSSVDMTDDELIVAFDEFLQTKVGR